MLGYAITFVLASAGLQSATGESVVRRVSSPYDSDAEAMESLPHGKHDRLRFLSGDEASEKSDEDQATDGSGMNCVVWGDWSFEGKKFATKEEAAEHFKQLKHTELAAVQLHGSHEVKRFLSKRLAHVDWAKMKSWCNGQDSEPALEESARPKRKKAAVHIGRNGAVSHKWEESLDRENSLFEASSRERRAKYNPVIASLASVSTGEATSLDTKASTLSGKVEWLESEVNSLASTASGLLKSIGVRDVRGASVLQVERSGHSHGKLKSRLASLEESTRSVQEKTNLLETELFGTTTEGTMGSGKNTGHSFKMKIEVLAAQVDELKSRLSAVKSTPLLGEVAKLEEKTERIGSNAARIFTSIGIESITATGKPPSSNDGVKARLSSLEGYAEAVQRNAATLEYEILGSSWNLPSSGGSQKTGSIKDHAISLGDMLHDLEGRISALANAPIVGDVGKMEGAATALSSRAAAISKNVGLSSKASQEGSLLASQDSPLKARISLLEKYVVNMQSTTAALEEELAGSVGTAPGQSQKDTLKSKVKFLELQVENINARISALEQQV